MAKVGRNEKCPCGSDKKYKQCCYNKGFDFVQKGHEIVRIQPVGEEFQSAAGKIYEEYLKRLERAPGAGDPIAIWQFYHGQDEMTEQICEAMKMAGIDAAKIWAYKKTGLMIVGGEEDKYTEFDINEWDDAIEEFYAHDGNPGRTPLSDRYDEVISQLIDEIISLIFLMGLASFRFFNSEEIFDESYSDSILSPGQYQAYCVARTQRSLRAIVSLIREKYGDAALKLARSMYENYLHIVFIRENPSMIQHLVDAKVGLMIGTHEYKRNAGGKVNKRVIVEKQTGEEFKGHISAFEMVSASPYPEDSNFFDFFYSFTSEDIHPDVNILHRYLSPDSGLQPLRRELQEESIIFSLLVGGMVADQIRYMQRCPEQLAEDVVVVVSRIRGLVREAIEAIATWSEISSSGFDEHEAVLRRCLVLPDRQ